MTFSYLPILMGVSILPFEISKYFPSLTNPPKTNTALLVIQYFFYYITLLISFFLNPFLIEFKKISENSDQSLLSRLWQAFRKLIFFYLIIGILAVVGFITLIASCANFNLRVLFGILPSILNMYGLVMYIITIGIGIIKIPITIWHNARPVNVLRDNLLLLDEVSTETQEESLEENNHARYYNYLLMECKKQYDKVIELDLKRNFKQILLQFLFYFLSILSGLLFLTYIVIECSFAFRDNQEKFILNIILTKINNQVINQLFLFVFVSLLVSVGAYILTCINIGNLFPETIRPYLARVLNIIDYRFVKGQTIPKTFEFWSTYLQRLVPTIAYHCQRLAGADQSSLEQIMGQLDQFYAFSKFVRITLPLFIFVVIVIYGLSILDSFPNTTKLANGLRRFKAQMIRQIGPNLDEYIIFDIFRIDVIMEPIRAESNNNLEIQLSSTSSFHDPPPVENNTNTVY